MIDVLNKGIYQKLAGNSALTSQLIGGGSAIYFGQAPSGTVKPYIVYSIAGGGDDHLSPTESVDVMYYVKGVADTASKAGQIAGLIRDTLHEADLTLDAPWSAYRCQHDNVIHYQETTDGKLAWHGGGSYRIRASK